MNEYLTFKKTLLDLISKHKLEVIEKKLRSEMTEIFYGMNI